MAQLNYRFDSFDVNSKNRGFDENLSTLSSLEDRHNLITDLHRLSCHAGEQSNFSSHLIDCCVLDGGLIYCTFHLRRKIILFANFSLYEWRSIRIWKPINLFIIPRKFFLIFSSFNSSSYCRFKSMGKIRASLKYSEKDQLDDFGVGKMMAYHKNRLRNDDDAKRWFHSKEVGRVGKLCHVSEMINFSKVWRFQELNSCDDLMVKWHFLRTRHKKPLNLNLPVIIRNSFSNILQFASKTFIKSCRLNQIW